MAKGKYIDWITSDGLLLIQGWARDGLSEEQISRNMGIRRCTLNEWKKKFPAISDALKKGKAPVDYEVENALLKRALGYEYEESKVDSSGKKTIVIRHIPPDVGACAIWLKNRKPRTWSDHPEQRAENQQGSEILQSLYELAVRRRDEQD